MYVCMYVFIFPEGFQLLPFWQVVRGLCTPRSVGGCLRRSPLRWSLRARQFGATAAVLGCAAVVACVAGFHGL